MADIVKASDNQAQLTETKARPIERFATACAETYGATYGTMAVSDAEMDLFKGYYLGISKALQEAKMSWGNVNMTTLTSQLIKYARMGMDMQIDNYLSPVPFREKDTGRVNINFIPGYCGREYLAKKLALDPYESLTVKLVGINDTFKPMYKDVNHPFDTYLFEENPFNKGNIVGGFAYIAYKDGEEKKNRLIVMSINEITAHEPPKGNPIWKGKWKEKMWLKTLIIAACKTIPMDADKVRTFRQELNQIKADEISAQYIEASEVAEQKMCENDVIDIDVNTGEVAELAECNEAAGESAAVEEPVEPAEPVVDAEIQENN